MFSSVNISTNDCVPCSGECVSACTTIFDGVTFGAQALSGNENVSASTIGHELVHTVGVYTGECAAYTWEIDHQSDTGIDQHHAYMKDVTNRKNLACE